MVRLLLILVLVVAVAVQQNGDALEFAHESLKEDVFLIAIATGLQFLV